ncbi:MAG: peptidoglycan-associated lipoprotein Pal [Pseudomonadota bacterium]
MNPVSVVLLLVSLLALAACGGNRSRTVPVSSEPTVIEEDSSASTSGTGIEDEENGVLGGLDEFEWSRDTVYFEFDQANVAPDYMDIVEAYVGWLLDNPNSRVRLEGHADERGSREYNIGLGERRAQAVRNIMRLRGVDDSQISTVSYGEERPVDSGHDENAWQANRRVQLIRN